MEENNRNEVVRKSNTLVNAMFDLSLQGQRFLAFSISKLDQFTPVQPGQPVEMEIDVPAFAEAFEIAPNYAYGLIETLADQLQKKIIQLETTPGTRVKVGLITKQKYQDGQGRVWIRFDEDLVPHLLGLKEKYTPYRIRDVYQFQRASTWRVYELLKQFKKIGKREFDLEEFKLKVGVAGAYARIGNLKQRVIDPAVEEINATSDIEVQWSTVKRGRAVAKLRFYIKSNESTVTERERKRELVTRLMDSKAPLKNPGWAEMLTTQFGVGKTQAAQMARMWEGREDEGTKILARIKTTWSNGTLKVRKSLGGYTFSTLKKEGSKGAVLPTAGDVISPDTGSSNTV